MGKQSNAMIAYKEEESFTAEKSKKKDNVYIFFVLTFPLLFIAFCFIEILFFSEIFSSRDTQYSINMLQEAFFLNGAHVYMSFAFLMMHPTGSKWVFSNKFVCFRMIIYVVALAVLYNYVNNFYRYLSIYLVLGLRFLSIHHNFSQQRGIWLLQKSINAKSVKVGVNFIMILFIFYWIALRMFHFDYKKTSVVGLGLLLVVLFYMFKKNQSSSFKDKVFSIRFFIPFLFPISNLANFGMASVHGMEYVWVQHKQESIRKNRIISVVVTVGLCIFLSLFLHYPEVLQRLTRINTNNFLNSSYVLSLSFGLTIGHYFLDHHLYSKKYGIKNLEVRQLLSKR